MRPDRPQLPRHLTGCSACRGAGVRMVRAGSYQPPPLLRGGDHSPDDQGRGTRPSLRGAMVSPRISGSSRRTRQPRTSHVCFSEPRAADTLLQNAMFARSTRRASPTWAERSARFTVSAYTTPRHGGPRPGSSRPRGMAGSRSVAPVPHGSSALCELSVPCSRCRATPDNWSRRGARSRAAPGRRYRPRSSNLDAPLT
jgi:hypothetical protein